MAPARIGTLRPEDRQAVFASAQRLGLNPYEFGALIHQESGFRPNVFGGAGGNYYGLIQFGGPERAKYLDKSKIGKYTIAEQLPAVEQFLKDRGFQPGKMGIDRAYATILGGNPNVSLTAKDSFGTSVASSIPKFKQGGSLYQQAQTTLGDPLNLPSGAPAPAPSNTAAAVQKGNTLAETLLKQVIGTALQQRTQSSLPSLLSPLELLQQSATSLPMPSDYLNLFQ